MSPCIIEFLMNVKGHPPGFYRTIKPLESIWTPNFLEFTNIFFYKYIPNYSNMQNISNKSQTNPLTNIYRLIGSTYIGLNLWNPVCADCCNPNHKRSAVALVVSSARLKGFGAAATAANWVQQTQSNTQAPLRHPAFAIRDQKIQSQNRGT